MEYLPIFIVLDMLELRNKKKKNPVRSKITIIHITCYQKRCFGGEFPDGPMVRNPSGIQSLVGELRSHKLHGVAKKINIFMKIFSQCFYGQSGGLDFCRSLMSVRTEDSWVFLFAFSLTQCHTPYYILWGECMTGHLLSERGCENRSDLVAALEGPWVRRGEAHIWRAAVLGT